MAYHEYLLLRVKLWVGIIFRTSYLIKYELKKLYIPMNILQIHFASACGREMFQRRTFAKRLAFHEYLLLRVKLWVRIILGHPVWSNLNWNSFIYPWRIYKSIMLHLVEGKLARKELLLRGWHIINIYCS